MQQASSGSDVALGIDLAANAGRRRSGRLLGQQIILEGAMVAATRHPDVRATEPVTQDGEDGCLVQAPVRHGAGEYHPAPLR